jgi:hypothetical protein
MRIEHAYADPSLPWFAWIGAVSAADGRREPPEGPSDLWMGRPSRSRQPCHTRAEKGT